MNYPTAGDNNTPVNWEEVLFNNRKAIIFLLIGLILLGVGVYFNKQKDRVDQIEILESSHQTSQEVIIAEIAGAVQKPGVYNLKTGNRIEDLLILAGGFSATADRDWIAKYLNRAAKLTDGQKIYIPSENQQSEVESATNIQGYQTTSAAISAEKGQLININTAGQKELESLWGIGPVYAQKITEQRPYSNIEELLSKKVLPKNTFEKIQNQISVY